jgi:hypothetical protein
VQAVSVLWVFAASDHPHLAWFAPWLHVIARKRDKKSKKL